MKLAASPVSAPQRPGRPKGQRYMEPTCLVTIRHRLGLTQAGLAKMVGVSRATVSTWENGHAPIHKAAAQMINLLFPWTARYPESGAWLI